MGRQYNTMLTLVKVSDLKPGMFVDMEPVVKEAIDPTEDDYNLVALWVDEYAVVEGIEQETPDCVRVDFENGPSWGFPIDAEIEADTPWIPRETQ